VNPRFIKEGRKLATIREVKDIREIPGADRIQLAIVDGWECVIKKNEVKTGDHIIYIEIDSILPEKPEFEFLRPRNFRIKTIKLRGQISQGLVLPISYLGKKKKYNLGEDVTSEMGIKKYDPEIIKEKEIRLPKAKNRLERWLMKFEWYCNWKKRKIAKKQKPFPSWISKTNETRIQNLVKDFEKAVKDGVVFFVTEKLDGQSFTTYINKQSTIGICSRNLEVSKADDSNYASIFSSCKLEKIMIELKKKLSAKTIILQGEICGPGIQSNKYKLSKLELFIFNFIIDGKIKNYIQMKEILEPMGLQLVPLLETNFSLLPTISDMVNYSKGFSSILPTQKREGLVIRNYEYDFSVKIINPEFSLEED